MTLIYKHLETFTTTEGYWNDKECLNIAKDILNVTKGKNLLEIGFNIGYSSAVWLESGIETLYIIDNNRHSDTVKAIQSTIDTFKAKNIKSWLLDSASQEAHQLIFENLDIIFIDGDHSESGIKNDLKLAFNTGAKWVVIDDYVAAGVNGIYEYVNKLLVEKKLTLIKKYECTWIGQGFILLCKINR